MNLRIRTFSMALVAMSAASQVYALPSDESENKEKKEERNVMLNASDANKPREIQIGLPSEDVTVYENGLPAVYSSSVHRLSAHWRSDASLKGTDLMTPSESAIATGNIAYAVSSFSELGQKEFKGKLNYKANHFGMQNVDLNLSGGIGDNWLYTASMYQNVDPGSFKLRFTDYADRTQLYHFGITRILNDGKGRISLLYKYSNSKNPGNFANAAPFIYSGDGSIKKIDGFDPGMDSYVQRQGSFQYLNTKSGKMETWNMSDGSENHANEIALISQYQFDNGWLWKFNAKYMNAPRANYVDYGGSTISQVSEADGYQLSDGSAYSGYIEGRRTWLHVGKVSNALLTAEISKQLNNHKLMIGLNEWYYHLNYYSSSFQWAGTVEAYPRTLSQMYVNPLDPTQTAHRSETFGYNELSPEYTKGSENKLALYFTDEWKVSPKFKVFYGGRLEYYRMSAEQISTPRFSGFHMGNYNTYATAADGSVVATEHSIEAKNVTKDKLNYNLTRQFGLTADATIATRFPRISEYAGTGPTEEQYKRVTIPLIRGGIFYKNDWIDLSSMVTYISKSNNIDQQNLTKPGTTEGKTVLLIYNIQTLGWTTSAEINPFKNFHMHALFTYQKPVYKNYNASVTFSDGQSMGVNANNMIVKEIPQVLIELDPKYDITKNLNAWLSFRYFGKTYANLQEALYFNGHWETFGGINWNVNKKLSLGVSVINIFNEKGAKGTISGSELITKQEAGKYDGKYMSGSYLRPFTVEFSAGIKF